MFALHRTLRASNPAAWLLRAVARLLAIRFTRKAPRLDPRTLSDYLKRDIGILDGRARSRARNFVDPE